MSKSTRTRSIVAAAFATLLGAPAAEGKDLKPLADLLASAFLARDMAAVCNLYDENFLAETKGPLGTIDVYVPHLKQEILASLKGKDAQQILDDAIAESKTLGRERARAVADPTVARRGPDWKDWCRAEAKPLVRQVMVEHDGDHASFLQTLEKLKAGNDAFQQVKVVGPGETSCRQFIALLPTNPSQEREYFAWAQGLMSGILLRAPQGIDENLDLLPATHPVAEQMKFVRAFCVQNPAQDYFEAVRALYRMLKTAAPK